MEPGLDYSGTFDLRQFIKIVDHIYDECSIWDRDFTLLYINRASIRLYGMYPEQLIGKKLPELMGEKKLWSPSTLAYVYRHRQPVMQEQLTNLGARILSVTVPVLDRYGEVEYCIVTSRESFEELAKKLSPATNVEMGPLPPEQDDIIYASGTMREIMDIARRVALTDAPCLLLGETGTGKSLFAKYIHDHSERSKKRFFSVNVASLNPNVIEAELFGYHKGAFTGAAHEGKKGYFQLADGGTLFLDEIGELPATLQAKFLHVIQEGEFLPLGSANPIKTDIRIISATNRDLAGMVRDGEFREDLYHRLNVFDLTLPPLRRRQEDLQLLANYYLNAFNKKYRRNRTLSEEIMVLLRQHTWPGNVRELSNVIERCVVISDTDTIGVKHLPGYFLRDDRQSAASRDVSDISDIGQAMDAFEKDIVNFHYKQAHSNRKLASALNVSTTTARRLIEKHIRRG